MDDTSNDMTTSSAPLGSHDLELTPDKGNNDDGSQQDPQAAAQLQQQLKKFQKYVKLGVDNWKRTQKYIKRGDRMIRGTNREHQEQQQQGDIQNSPTQVNFLRQKIARAVTQIYSRNPKFTVSPKHPIMVPADPVPTPTPMGVVMMPPPPDPVTGQPAEKDVSDKICDVVAVLMEHVFDESKFKAEAKACCLEAHHRPGSVLQTGYQFDEAQKTDDIYFRWRSFKTFINDPSAQIYNGIVRKCRFMGIKWTLRQSEAKALGLNWDSMQAEHAQDIESEQTNPQDEPQRDVFQVWSQELGLLAWCSESGPAFAKAPEPWPWQISGYPFSILKFTEDTDKQFSRPIILEAEGLQEEFNEMRETMQSNIVMNRRITLYDSEVISQEDVTALAGRRPKGWKGIDGLSTRASPPMQVFNEDKLDDEFFQHYERNGSDMDTVLGTSANEQSQADDVTATEATVVANNQNVATTGKADVLNDFLNDATTKAVEIMRQTYTDERVTRITSPDGTRFWVTWKGSEILSHVDVKTRVGSAQQDDDSVKKQVALNLFSTLQTVQGINVKKLANDVLIQNGKFDTDQYWIAQPQIPGAPPMPGQPPIGAPMGPPQGAPPIPPAPQKQPHDVAASLRGKVTPIGPRR